MIRTVSFVIRCTTSWSSTLQDTGPSEPGLDSPGLYQSSNAYPLLILLLEYVLAQESNADFSGFHSCLISESRRDKGGFCCESCTKLTSSDVRPVAQSHTVGRLHPHVWAETQSQSKGTTSGTIGWKYFHTLILFLKEFFHSARKN